MISMLLPPKPTDQAGRFCDVVGDPKPMNDDEAKQALETPDPEFFEEDPDA